LKNLDLNGRINSTNGDFSGHLGDYQLLR